MTLDAGTSKSWQLSFDPPEGLIKEIISGEIYFGKALARQLFIAVRGPDPKGWRPDAKPDVDDKNATLLITDKAQIVATYAPRVRIDWWRNHPSSSITAGQMVKPLLTLASRGKSDYVILTDLPPDADKDNGAFKLAVYDLARCIGIIADGAQLEVVDKRPAGSRAIVLRQ